nr:MAG TPA: hypothetical protein [Caudoviricetes sp.]DAM63188.1 MAG TPA: hypothetical protein [Caudoviricetes sp.]DAU26926.1 MAG TPA: hypothetical protein [Caudoviricetes sp.]
MPSLEIGRCNDYRNRETRVFQWIRVDSSESKR